MNAPATTNNPVAAFSGFLDKLKPQLALALPKHMGADRMARLALTAFSTNLALQDCTPKSIAAALMTAGQLGLEPGVNGAGFLIPYKTTCTFVPGWKGLVDLVSRSGRGTVYTGVIFKDQDYTFIDGAKRDLIIHNETDLDAPEDITHAFAIGWVKDANMPIIELWTVGKIKKHRDKYNKVGAKHYSFRDWEMYCRKVPLLQVLKYMPSSIELSNAIAVSNASEAGHGATIDGLGIVIEDDDGSDGDDSGRKEEKKPDFYPHAAFEAELAKPWGPLLASGKKMPEQVITAMQSKHPLTDDQKKAIHALAKKPDTPSADGVMSDAEIAAARARELAEAGQQ
jgi:recombination protein RecT